ncbi:cytochrome P450 [Aspergillus spinulosporus]
MIRTTSESVPHALDPPRNCHLKKGCAPAGRDLLVQGALVGIITYWVIWMIYTQTFHPLAKFLGSFWASVTRFWTVLHVLPGDAEKRQRKPHAEYGPVVRIAPNELITSDPEAINTLYGVKSSTTKTDFYLAFRPPWARFPDHFSSQRGKQHGDRRRIVSNVYTMTSLGEISDRKESFDLWIWTRMYAYDVIGELYFSKMFGFLQAGGDQLGYTDATDDLISVQFLAGNMPTYVRSLFMLTGIVFPKVRRALKALDILTNATNEMLKGRVAALDSNDATSKPQRADILGKLLDIMHKRGKEVDFEIRDVKMECFGGFFAGSETTALTLSGIFYHILHTPRIYTKLQAEIDAAASSGQLSTPHIAYTEAVKLPYLVACIEEGMCMHPITGVSFPRHAPAQGCSLGGYYIPGNARIGVNPAVIHFDKSVYGDDADVFSPERWIEASADKERAMDGCISMCEIYKAIPQLMKEFTFELATKKMQTTSYWPYKPVSIEVNVRRR